MVYSPPCLEPKAFGLIDLKMASPAFVGTTQQPLIDLGTTSDSISIQERPYYHDIHCDSNGGMEGPPSEVQHLGYIVMINFQLKAWNEIAIDIIRKRSVNVVRGTIEQGEVGEMMLKEKSVRLLLDTVDPLDRRNFWCCLFREPIEIAMGTKHASYHMSAVAYRPPCYHQKANILEDQDNT